MGADKHSNHEIRPWKPNYGRLGNSNYPWHEAHITKLYVVAGGEIDFPGRSIPGDTLTLTSSLSINDATYSNQGIQLDYNSGTPRAYIGDGTDQYFKFDGANTSWKGTNTELTTAGQLSVANLSATGGTIGGWTINANSLSSTNLTIDNANERIRSTNYVSGVNGVGFTLEPNLLEVANISCRGIFKTVVFQKDVVSVLGGNFIVMPGDVLATDMTAADASTLTIKGNETFSVADVLRIKDGVNDEWLAVSNTGAAPTYTVTRDLKGDYAADSNPQWKAGASVTNYRGIGDGGIYMTSSESNAPYIEVIDHSGSPWASVNTRMRLGNLNGYLGYSADAYGIGIGSSAANQANITFDSTNGIRLRTSTTDQFVIDNSGNAYIAGAVLIGGASGVAGSSISGWAHGSDTTKIDGGDIYTNTITATQIAANTITASEIAANTITTTEIAATTIVAGDIAASTLTATQINGAGFGTLTISSGKIAINTTDALEIQAAGNVLIKQGADIVLEGGASGNPSLIRLKDEAVPGEIRFEQSGDSGNYHSMYKETTLDSLVLYPEGLTTPLFSIGKTTNQYSTVNFHLSGAFAVYVGGAQRFQILESSGSYYSKIDGVRFSPASDSTTTLGHAGVCWSDVYADAGVTACSDEKWKTIIGQEPLGLDFVNKLPFIEYELNRGGKKRNGKYRGITGQDLEQALIESGYDPHEFAGLEYNKRNGETWLGIIYEQLMPSFGVSLQQIDKRLIMIEKKLGESNDRV